MMIIHFNNNHYLYALERCAEAASLCIYENECTHFHKRRSREQRSFVGLRENPHPVVCCVRHTILGITCHNRHLRL